MSTCLTALLTVIALGQAGTLAFITGPTQADYQLALVDVESGAVTHLGQGTADAYPAWSPDGRSIAYQSRQPNGTGIRVAWPEEGRDEALEHRFNWNYRPDWSPCGDRIAYSSDGEDAPLQSIAVHTLSTGAEAVWGGTQRGLITPVWMPTTDLMKALDPDDRETAELLGLFEIQQEAEEHGVITAVGLTGAPPRISTELFVVTKTKAAPLLPFLVPDSHRYVKYGVRPDHRARQIAYESNDGGDRELFILGRRGITNVSNHPAADWNPVWSPDNNWLAFESFRDGRRGIYRVLAATANVSPVTVDATYDCWSPAWSPDGKWIAFVSDKTGTPQLYVIRPDGSGLHPVTAGEHPALSPSWQPQTN